MRETAALALLGLAGALTATNASAQVDRYGGSAERRPTRVATAGPWQMRAPAAEAGRTLSWPGKISGVRAEAPPSTPTSQAGAEPSRAAAPAALPTSIYAAPPPAAAQAQPVAATPGSPPAPTARRADGPRFYSVHRDFGIAPDAAPIPPQFFAETADLSEPPPPVAWDRRNVTTGGKTTTVVRRASSGSN